MHNVIRLASIRHTYLESALHQLGYEWGAVMHIAASTSLRHAIATHGGKCMTMSTLMQLIDHLGYHHQIAQFQANLARDIAQLKSNGAQQGVNDLVERYNTNQHTSTRVKAAINAFPSIMADDFDDQLVAWHTQNQIQHFQNIIVATNIIIERINATPEPKPSFVKAIYEARNTVRDSIRSLIDSGFTPDDIADTDDDPLMRWVVETWRIIEQRIPEITWMRQVYWEQTGDTTLGAQIIAELWRTVWQPARRTALVFHGFRSYTPTQWALFRLLQQQTDIPVIWMMHDDGVNPAFESWRMFFDEKWQLPIPITLPCDETPLANAQLLLAGFDGAPVRSEHASLKLVEYTSPAHFVKAIDDDSDYDRFRKRYTPQLYAAAPDQIRRYFQRLDKASAHTVVDMSDLPLGIFLTRLHQTWPNTYRNDIEITTHHVSDMLVSGYIPAPAHIYEVWQRVEPYFSDCTSTRAWRDRARQLCHLQSLAERIGPKHAQHNDVERLRMAARNHYRLVSWVDITKDEAHHIADVIETIVSLIEQMSDSDRIDIYQHFETLQRQLDHGLKNLAPAERTQVLDRLQWFDRSFQGRFYPEAVIEAVKIVLGQSTTIGQHELNDEEQERVRSLHSLDALSFVRRTEEVHIANMADGVFPTIETSLGWPFERHHFTATAQAHTAMLLFETLQESAHIRDIYALWVALDGIDAPVTISWITQMNGEERNRAAVLELIAQTTLRAATHVHQQIGGVEVKRERKKAKRTKHTYSTLYLHQDESVTPELIRKSWKLVPREAGSAWILCARRFVLQWGLGSSISYQSDHHQRMLYGNFRGASERQSYHDYAPEADAQTVELMWPHILDGIKTTYEQHAAVGQAKANYKWLYTMKGSTRTQDGDDSDEDDRTRHSKALQYIVNTREPLIHETNGKYSIFPHNLAGFSRKICANCPVQRRCAAADDGEGV